MKELKMKFNDKKILTIPEQIVQFVKQSIIDGDIKPGDKLPSEESMAASLGVSRPTVRDALNMLEASKYIYTKRGAKGGHFISNITLESITYSLSEQIAISLGLNNISVEEVVEIRRLVEIQATYIAANKRTDEDLANMKKLFTSSKNNSIVYTFEKDYEFHVLIAKATHNRLIELTVKAIITALNPSNIIFPPYLKDKLYNEIYNIYLAIKNKDAELASKLMEEHIDGFADFINIAE